MTDTLLTKIGLMFTIFTCNTPLEIIKMRLMNSTELYLMGRIKGQYHSISNCFRTIRHDQGTLAFWKGNLVMLGRILPIESINYFTRKNLQMKFPNTLMNNVFISVVSGITASTLIYPTDIVRQLMNNNTNRQLSIWRALKQIKQDHGFKYFYKGYPNVLLSLAVYRSCYNGTYDTLKGTANDLKEKAVIAYLCSVFAEYAVYPIEIVRRRRIAIDAKEGFIKYSRFIWTREGVKGFYKGGVLVPFQSVSWALCLIIFDTSGLKFQTAVQI